MSRAGCMELGSGSFCETPHHLLLGTEQTKRTCSSFVTNAVNPWRVVNQSKEERRGEGKVRNVFKCKDHKFNTFSCMSREAGRRS